MAKTTKTSKVVSENASFENADSETEVLKKAENGEDVVNTDTTVDDALNAWDDYGRSDCDIGFIDNLINNKIIMAENILKNSISILSIALKTELEKYNEVRNTHNNFECKKHILMTNIIDHTVNR